MMEKIQVDVLPASSSSKPQIVMSKIPEIHIKNAETKRIQTDLLLDQHRREADDYRIG